MNQKKDGEMMAETKKQLKAFLAHHGYEILEEIKGLTQAKKPGGDALLFRLRQSAGTSLREGTLEDGTPYQLRELDPTYEGAFVQIVYGGPDSQKSSTEIKFPSKSSMLLNLLQP